MRQLGTWEKKQITQGCRKSICADDTGYMGEKSWKYVVWKHWIGWEWTISRKMYSNPRSGHLFLMYNQIYMRAKKKKLKCGKFKDQEWEVGDGHVIFSIPHAVFNYADGELFTVLCSNSKISRPPLYLFLEGRLGILHPVPPLRVSTLGR